MKYALILLVFLSAFSDPSEIARNNKLKRKAAEAYDNGRYEEAVSHYGMLYDSLGVEDPAIGLNLAHSYFALGDTSNAKLMYQNIATSNNKDLKSIAYQQLGVMSKTPQSLKESLQYLKSSLKANPLNEEARYNYEVVKKLIKEQEQQKQDQNQDDQNQENQDQENQDQENKDQQENKENQDQENQDQQDQQQDQQDQENKDQEQQEQQQKDQEGKEGEEKEQQQKEGQEQDDENQKQQPNPDTKQKLEEMNISEEKARMILEAMRNNEVQYIQQQKRRATQPQNSGKPDW